MMPSCGRLAVSCAGCCFLLAGCTVGPNYRRPSAPVPPAYAPTAALRPAVAADSLGDLTWWSVFRDPALQVLIQRARVNDPDVKIAATRVELVQAEFAGVRANYLPQVQAQANETLQRISPIGLPKNRTSGNPAGSASILGTQATWEIDFWGKYRRANEAGRAAMLSSRAAQSAVASSLVAAVATAYFQLLELDEESKAADRLLVLRQRGLTLIQARMGEGVSSLADVRYAEVQVEQQREALARLRQASEDRESEIRELLGESAGKIERGMGLWQETLPEVGPGLPSSLLERRPDIQQAEQELIAANANIGIVKAEYFPNIGITAGGGLESTALRNLFSGDAQTWLLQPAVNLPVFTGGRIHAEVRQADAQRDIMAHQYVSTVESAFRDVAQALAHREQAEEVEAQQASIVKAAEGQAYLAEERRKAGVSSALNVIDSDQTEIAAQIDQARFRCEQLNAVVQLYRALGGGWQP